MAPGGLGRIRYCSRCVDGAGNRIPVKGHRCPHRQRKSSSTLNLRAAPTPLRHEPSSSSPVSSPHSSPVSSPSPVSPPCSPVQLPLSPVPSPSADWHSPIPSPSVYIPPSSPDHFTFTNSSTIQDPRTSSPYPDLFRHIDSLMQTTTPGLTSLSSCDSSTRHDTVHHTTDDPAIFRISSTNDHPYLPIDTMDIDFTFAANAFLPDAGNLNCMMDLDTIDLDTYLNLATPAQDDRHSPTPGGLAASTPPAPTGRAPTPPLLVQAPFTIPHAMSFPPSPESTPTSPATPSSSSGRSPTTLSAPSANLQTESATIPSVMKQRKPASVRYGKQPQVSTFRVGAQLGFSKRYAKPSRGFIGDPGKRTKSHSDQVLAVYHRVLKLDAETAPYVLFYVSRPESILYGPGGNHSYISNSMKEVLGPAGETILQQLHDLCKAGTRKAVDELKESIEVNAQVLMMKRAQKEAAAARAELESLRSQLAALQT